MSSEKSSPPVPSGFIARLLKQADGNIVRTSRMLATTSNLETLLLTVSYTLHLAHAALARATSIRLAKAAESLANKLTEQAPGTLLPGEAIVATLESAPDSRLVRAEQSTTAFLKVIDEVRTFLRLKSLIGMYAWGSNSVRNPHADAVLQRITLAQVLCCSGFAVLENYAYLASKGVFAVEPSKISRLFVWSARAWTTHVFLDFARLYRTAQIREVRGAAQGGKGEKLAAAEDALWWNQLYVNSAWAPLAVSWSLGPEKGYAGEAMIATLGGFAGWNGLLRAWRATPAS